MDANEIKAAAEKAIKSVDLSKLKPGVSTSEFGLVGATVAATFIAAAFKVAIPPETLLGLYTLVAGYVAKRWHLKALEAKRK